MVVHDLEFEWFKFEGLFCICLYTLLGKSTQHIITLSKRNNIDSKVSLGRTKCWEVSGFGVFLFQKCSGPHATDVS